MGILYLVATPIGNLEDITIRAIRTLFTVDYIACEDTRHTGQLIKNYEIRIKNNEISIKGLNIVKKPNLIPFYDQVEEKKIPYIIELLESGKSLALVCDSGTPLIADPGYKLVRECIRRGIKVIPVPGASALLTALSVSSLPIDNFFFIGYLPKKKNKRLSFLKSIFLPMRPHRYSYTIVAFEAPHRLKESLEDIKEVFGDIEIVIARELTKIHEEIWRGKISQAIYHFTIPKGEFVMLFSRNERGYS